MERYAVDCDVCRSLDVKNALSLTATVGTYMDAAGDTDTREARLDVCPTCQRRLLQEAFARLVQEAKDPYAAFCELLGPSAKDKIRINPPIGSN